nr:MAG TPA_asm: RecQ zinc-binding protein [Caudoviricetes sp.]
MRTWRTKSCARPTKCATTTCRRAQLTIYFDWMFHSQILL